MLVARYLAVQTIIGQILTILPVFTESIISSIPSSVLNDT